MHLAADVNHLLAHLIVERYTRPAVCLTIKQVSFRHFAQKHFFKADSLSRQLQYILVCLFQ
jgi:hypothetical protein